MLEPVTLTQPTEPNTEDSLILYVTRVRDLRKRSGMSMNELSVRAGVSTGVLARIETAQEDTDIGLVGLDKLIKIADAMETTAASLYPRLKHLTPSRKEQD